MEETGILENPALLPLVLPDFEPGRFFRMDYRHFKMCLYDFEPVQEMVYGGVAR